MAGSFILKIIFRKEPYCRFKPLWIWMVSSTGWSENKTGRGTSLRETLPNEGEGGLRECWHGKISHTTVKHAEVSRVYGGNNVILGTCITFRPLPYTINQVVICNVCLTARLQENAMDTSLLLHESNGWHRDFFKSVMKMAGDNVPT